MEMGGRGSHSSSSASGMSKVIGYKPKIVRETEKAYELDIETITTPRIVGYNSRTDNVTYSTRGQSVWVPKSQVKVKNGEITHMQTWLAKQKGIVTQQTKKDKEIARSNYNNLVAEAKSLGIKGARSGLKTSTLKNMINNAKGGE